MSGDETPNLLSIGIASGGVSDTNGAVLDALRVFMRLVVSERQGFGNDGLRMNIVFHVPGHMHKPDYTGVHATRIDKRTSHLLVVSAVPDDLQLSQVRTFAAETLQLALGEAQVYLAARRLAYDTGQLRALVAHLVMSLTTN